MKRYFLQDDPAIIPTTDGKSIEEHFGLASDGGKQVSIARMIAPPGWSEPFQNPEFDEFTLVLNGKKQIKLDNETINLSAGQSIKILKNTRVRYSNPFGAPCEYISVCTPAFDVNKVNREKHE